MTRSTHTRIDPWSRWANFTMDSWECWLDACCKRSANDGATALADLVPPPLRDGAEARRGTPLRVAER